MAVIDVKVEQPLGRFCWIYLCILEGIQLKMGFGWVSDEIEWKLN